MKGRVSSPEGQRGADGQLARAQRHRTPGSHSSGKGAASSAVTLLPSLGRVFQSASLSHALWGGEPAALGPL